MVFVEATSTMEEVMKIFVEKKNHRVFVAEDNIPKIVLTLVDIIRQFQLMDEKKE